MRPDWQGVTTVRRSESLVRELESHEPRTSSLISGLTNYPEWRFRRAWRVANSEGDLAAAVVAVRQCFDCWSASVYLPDAAAAPVVARILERSPIVAATGSAPDIVPLIELVGRQNGVSVCTWAIVPHPVEDILAPPTDRTRVATLTDLDALTDLYSAYEYVQVPTRWQLRSYLRRVVDRHLVVVYEIDHLMIGALAIDGRTNAFVIMNDLTVLPQHRRAGVGWELLQRAMAVAGAMRLGASLAIAETNPMTSSDDRVVWSDDHYYTLSLRHLRRFKGQTRLRRIYRRVQPISPRPAELEDPLGHTA